MEETGVLIIEKKRVLREQECGSNKENLKKCSATELVHMNLQASSAAVQDIEGKVRTHGALMLVAFVVLMPIAVLLARHRWGCWGRY